MNDKRKNTTVYKQQDFDKMKQNLTNLEKANKVSIRFSINYFIKFCVDNGTDNSTYCNYFMMAEGHLIVNEILEKFMESENSLYQLLAIIDSTLKSLNDKETAYQISGNNFVKKLILIIDKNQFQNCSDLAYDILNKIVYFENTHQNCLDQGLLQFIKSKLETLKKSNKEEPLFLLQIAKLFNLIKFLSRNQVTLQIIQQEKIFDGLIEIYLQNEEIDFLKDILIEVLEEMSDNQNSVEIIKKSNLDFQNLLEKTILSRNQDNIKKMQKIIENFADEKEIKNVIQQALSGSSKAILHLGFLSSIEIYIDLLEDQNLRDFLMQRLNEKSSSEIEKFAIIKFMSQLVQYDSKYLKYFDQKQGIDSIIQTIEDPTDDSYFYLTQTLSFFNTMLDLKDENFISKLKQKQIPQKFYKFFINFSSTYENFKRLGLSQRKALQSIQYNKSEASKKLLLAQKQINEKEIVSEKIALNYLSCQSLSIEVVRFIGKIEQSLSEILYLDKDYFQTILLLLKVFKNDKQIYNIVFESLSQFNYEKKQGEFIYKLSYMNFLCDKIWLKPQWNIFSLYCLRFMEKLTNNPEIIQILKHGVNAIKLVASIKNFINEEEYKVFEEIDDEEEEDDLNLEKLTYSQEREIHKKSAFILEKLLDSTSLETFKSNINKTVSNFKPQSETIMILRAEYGVLACINGINIFGIEGLKNNLQIWLKENVERIEKNSKNQDFPNKEKLLADCIKAISNYICITWNKQGRDQYLKKEVSVIVFELLEKYLKESKYPLKTYVMLRVFKDWLIERIEIIENATNLERMKIYDENSFMIVPSQSQDQIIVNILDALYSTNQKFSNVEKVIQLNYEVIVLLGYVYPQWSSKVARNFIPQILDILDTQDFSLDADGQAIDLLKNLTGCDGRQSKPNQDLIDIAAQKGALQIIAKSISKHDYDQGYIDKCKDLLDNLGQNEKNLESCYDTIDQLIEKLDEKVNSNLNDPENLVELTRLNDQLNAFCIVDPLRLYAFENGHPEAINKLWAKVQDKISQKSDNLGKLEKLENGCVITMAQHLAGGTDQDLLNKLYGNQNDNDKDDNNLALNALRSIQLNKKDPKLVQLNSKIVNKCFPGPNEKNIKSLAKKLNFQDDLDYVFNKHGKSNNPELSQEVTNLYVNLSINKNDDMIERIMKKNARQLKQDLNQENLPGVIKSWATFLPYLEDPIFIENYEELEIQDNILKTLELIKKNTETKIGKDFDQMVQEFLGNPQIPDLGINNRNKLSDEIKLAKNITNLMLKLPEEGTQKLIKNGKIVDNSNVTALLNGSPETFKLFEKFLENPENKNLMNRNKTLECGTYLLMKNNKDTFKPEELGNQMDLTVSTLHSVIKSIQPQNDLSTSQIYTQKANNNNQKIIQENLDDFGRMADQILTPQAIDDIFKRYAKALKNYQKDNQDSLQKLLTISRIVSSLLVSCPGSIELQKYGEPLLHGFQTLFNNLREEKVPNKKLMKFTENNFNQIGLILEGTDAEFKNPLLWNLFIERYFILSPGIIRSNPQTIFSNLQIALPFDNSQGQYDVKFYEKTGGLLIKGNLDQKGLLMEANVSKANDIILNFYYGITKNEIPEEIALNNLQALCKSSDFCEAFLKTKHFQEFFNRLKDSKLLPDNKFFNKNCEILKNVAISVGQAYANSKHESLEKFQKLSSEELLYPFIEIVEDQNMSLLPKAVESLLLLYDIIKSRQVYFDRKFPISLKGLLKQQKLKTNNALILLCKLLSDSSLESNFENLNLFEEAKNTCKKELFIQNAAIKNPNEFSSYQSYTILPDNQKKQNLALQAYTLGELSRTQKNSKDLANPKNNLMDVFELYNQFESYCNIPIIAVKTLEAVKNGVYSLSEQTLIESEAKINKIIKQIPPQIQKYENFSRTQNLLKDILDFFQTYLKNKRPKSEIERFLEHLSQNQNQSGKERLKDSQQIATLYDELNKELMKKPFNNDQIRIYEMLNNEVNELLNKPNSDAHFPLFNLKVAQNLRLIANNPNSSFDEKFDALCILNKFVQNSEILSKMLNESFYVDKSNELINSICQGSKLIQEIPEDQLPTLHEDLKFMKQLTSKKEGVDYVMKAGNVDLIPLIKHLFDILMSKFDKSQIKIEALQILKNLLNFSENKNLEDKILNSLPQLLQKCQDNYDLTSDLIDLANLFASKNDENKQKLIEKDILKPANDFLKIYKNKGHSLNTSCAKLIYQLSNEKPANLDYVMKSGVVEILGEPFKDTKSEKDFHESMAKNMLQLSFQNPERKQKLVDFDYIKGLVPLFKHYSSPDTFDEKMISLILKCMANFSLIPQGISTLLKDGVIPAFQNFFDQYKETLNDQNLLMLCTLSNLSYEDNDKFLTKILNDGGLDLILQALDFYNKNENENCCEASIDALTHLASTQKTVDLLKDKKLHSIDTLVDILRQQLSSPLVYKSLRCLTKFCEYDTLSERFMDKKGAISAMDLIKPYKKDLKNVFQTLKLMGVLLHKYPNRIEDFAFAGIPEKILDQFDMEWPIEIIKKIIELFARTVKNDQVKDILADNFLSDLIKIMNDFFKNKQVIRNGVILLALCSDNISSVAIVQKEKGNELTTKILKKYISSEDIVYNDLILIENLIRMHKDSKKEYLELKADQIVENIVDTTSPDKQKKLHDQAVRVLELLKGKNFRSIEESLDVETLKQVQNPQDQIVPEEIQHENRKESSETIKDTNFADLIPPNISKFLKNGRILRVYGEDSVCRSMHFFLSKDMLDIKCKHPKENFIKQKWIIPIHQIKEIKYKYDKNSPIAKSANFFRKAPAKEKCFAVFGPIVYGGKRNFHVVCENSLEAKQWYDYLLYVWNEYKQAKKRNLTLNNS